MTPAFNCIHILIFFNVCKIVDVLFTYKKCTYAVSWIFTKWDYTYNQSPNQEENTMEPWKTPPPGSLPVIGLHKGNNCSNFSEEWFVLSVSNFRTLCKWNYSLWLLLLLVLLGESPMWSLAVIAPSSSLPYTIPFCVYTTSYFSILFLVGIWVSSFWLLQIVGSIAFILSWGFQRELDIQL